MRELFSVSNHRPTHPESFKKLLNAFFANAKDGLYWFQPQRVTDKRTLSQNSYLWALCEHLGKDEAIGMTKELVLKNVMQDLNMGTWRIWGDRKEFQRDSSADKDKIKCGQIIDRLFEVAQFLNEDREPEHHIILPVPPQKGEK